MAQSELFTIAIDAMGGDKAPKAVIKGVDIFAGEDELFRFCFYGDEAKIKSLLANCSNLTPGRYDIIHCNEMIDPNQSPVQALRDGRGSSMRKALEAVKEGKAHAAVSAGNTGALMAMAKFVIRMLPGLDRPAFAAFVPTRNGQALMLDLGANVESNSDNLVQFALMGNAFATHALKKTRPKIAILNIGEEEIKGNDSIKNAAKMLTEKRESINFIGFVEGDTMIDGNAEVIVTDGFTGNVALKAMEGTAKFIRYYIEKSFSASLLAKIGYLLSRNAFRNTFKTLDHRLYNGAILLGLNGIVVKSHGSADEIAFAQALRVAKKLVESKTNHYVAESLAQFASEII